MNRVRRELERPIFVVGCCNSGTTILWQALRAHPDVTGPTTEGQDLPDLPSCMRHFLGRQTSRMFAHPRFKLAYRLTEQDYDAALAERIAAVYAEHAEPGKRFIEKSPANSLRTRFLQSVFPDATFVLIVRHGLAVAEGIRRKRAFDPERPHLAGLPTTIDDAALQWYHANRVLLNDRGFLRRSILIRYEALVRDPATALSAVAEFCGCDQWNLTIPRFDADNNQRQIARLATAEIARVEAIAGRLLSELGYRAPTTAERPPNSFQVAQ